MLGKEEIQDEIKKEIMIKMKPLYEQFKESVDITIKIYFVDA